MSGSVHERLGFRQDPGVKVLGKKQYEMFHQISSVRKTPHAGEDDKLSFEHVEFEMSVEHQGKGV